MACAVSVTSAMQLARLALITSAAASQRTELNFNRGWRFAYEGDPDAAGPGTCHFDDSFTDADCTGLERNPNRFNYTDCEQACCYDPSCLGWQQAVSNNGKANSDRTCTHAYVGSSWNCTPSSKPNGHVGGQRPSSPVPAYLTNRSRGGADFDDRGWELVDAPHDFVARNGTISEGADSHRGYFSRGVGWYRKHFRIPEEWSGSALSVRFEGAFHVAEVWLNGEFILQHTDGYLGFTARLDNVSTLRVGPANANVLAVRVDASFGSGHWYEGGGLWRGVQLVRTHPLHLVEHGAFVSPEVAAAGSSGASSVACEAEAEWASVAAAASARAGSPAGVRCALYPLHGDAPLGTCFAALGAVAPGDTPRTTRCSIETEAALTLWSVEEPVLYSARVSVLDPSGTEVDATNLTTAFRTTRWDEHGFHLNGAHLKQRGFSHHHSFAGVGAAADGIERLHLFKAQTSRALGANSWRMSHNPYGLPLYSVLDALGVLVWDENRDYGAPYTEAMGGLVKRSRNHPSVTIYSFCNEFECEQLLAPNATARAYRAQALAQDTSRPLSANNNGNPLYEQAATDVQGMSHRTAASFKAFRKTHPHKPAILSECCSCDSQRRDSPGNIFDSDLATDRRVQSCVPTQNSPGLLDDVVGSNGVWTLFDYFGEPNGVGGWPKVSCSFGQLDIAGFPKPHAYWYAAKWLGAHAADQAGAARVVASPAVRVLDLVGMLLPAPSHAPLPAALAAATPRGAGCAYPLDLNGLQCHGLSRLPAVTSSAGCEAACCAAGAAACEVWQWDAGAAQGGCWTGRLRPSSCRPPKPGSKAVWVSRGANVTADSCSVSVLGLSNSSLVLDSLELLTGGASRGVQHISHAGDDGSDVGAATFTIPCNISANGTTGSLWPGTRVEAIGRSADGSVLASQVLAAPAAATRLTLTLDVPSRATGTGDKLLLDGRDLALVRAAVVDGDGRLVPSSTARVHFRVTSGPGRVVGTGNGDPTSHEQPSSASVSAFGGLARGLIGVAADCASPHAALRRLVEVDGERTTPLLPPAAAPSSFTVEASADGLGSATLAVPLSCDEAKDGALAVARRVHLQPKLDFSFLRDFEG